MIDLAAERRQIEEAALRFDEAPAQRLNGARWSRIELLELSRKTSLIFCPRRLNQHHYLEEMREALTKWAARLRSIVELPAANVVTLRRRVNT
jgi:hypothetical protein